MANTEHWFRVRYTIYLDVNISFVINSPDITTIKVGNRGKMDTYLHEDVQGS